ncbi:MAG: PEP-CTERM sorting domain-containing protein [Lentimonas sp.]
MKKKSLPLAFAGLFAATLPVMASVNTSFDIDLSPDAQNFAVNAATSLTLTYTIDGSGGIALDANAPGGGAARWDQIDNGTAGTTASAALFNTSLVLTYSGSANPFLTNPTNYGNAGTGSVLSTQGQGNGNVLENGEFITFTVSGTATAVSGFSLDLVDFSYDNRLANGGSSFGVEDTTGTIVEQTIPNTSPDGTISGGDISLAAGESMTFRTIDGNAGGAGLNGFNFTVVPEPGSFALLGGLCAMAAVALRRRLS